MWDSETLFELVGLSDPRISRSGEWCAYVLSKPDLVGDKYDQTLVIRSLGSGEERFVSKGYMPRFSTDSKRLSYITPSDSTGRSELWVMDLLTGSSRKLLEVEYLVDALWSPRGDRLCLVASKKRGDTHLYFEEDAPVWFNSKGFFDSEKAEFRVVDSSSVRYLKASRRTSRLSRFSRWPSGTVNPLCTTRRAGRTHSPSSLCTYVMGVFHASSSRMFRTQRLTPTGEPCSCMVNRRRRTTRSTAIFICGTEAKSRL